MFESLAERKDDPTYLDLVPMHVPEPGATGIPKFSAIIESWTRHTCIFTPHTPCSQVTQTTPFSQTRYFAVENDEFTLDPGRTEDGFGNVTVGDLACAMIGGYVGAGAHDA